MAVGKLAQIFFNLLCTGDDVVANPPLEDERGWDFLVEFSNPIIESSVATDRLHEGYLQCKVQVKGSYDPISHSDDIKLSNWHYMCTDPTPYFVVLIQINKHDTKEAITIDLIHVDSDYIYKTLNRIREKQHASPNKRLSEYSMRVKATSETKICPINRENLLTSIRKHIGTEGVNLL